MLDGLTPLWGTYVTLSRSLAPQRLAVDGQSDFPLFQCDIPEFKIVAWENVSSFRDVGHGTQDC